MVGKYYSPVPGSHLAALYHQPIKITLKNPSSMYS